MIGAVLASLQEVLSTKPWCDGLLDALGALLPSCVIVSPTFQIPVVPPVL